MARKKLPNRRAAQNFTFILGKLLYTCNVGYYDKHYRELGEIFISCGKSGSDAQLVMLEAATAVSLALQHGSSVIELYAAMPKKDDGRPEGPIGTLLFILAKAESADVREELLT